MSGRRPPFQLMPEHSYKPQEFVHRQYLLNGPGWAYSIEHLPSGIVKHVYYRPEDEKPDFAEFRLFAELVSELLEKNIPPQPPKIGVKKIGKPRWIKTEKQSDI